MHTEVLLRQYSLKSGYFSFFLSIIYKFSAVSYLNMRTELLQPNIPAKGVHMEAERPGSHHQSRPRHSSAGLSKPSTMGEGVFIFILRAKKQAQSLSNSPALLS